MEPESFEAFLAVRVNGTIANRSRDEDCCLKGWDAGPCEGPLTVLEETGDPICQGHKLELINQGLIYRLMRPPVAP